MDDEMQQFCDDLLSSVEQMKTTQRASETKVFVSEVLQARNNTGLSQLQFAQLMGVSVDTLQEWEQGRHQLTGAASTLLKIAQLHPETLRELVDF